MRTLLRILPLFALFFGNSPAWADPVSLSQAVRRAAEGIAPRLVRINTIGGRDRSGEELTNEGATTGLLLDDQGYIITSAFHFLHEPSSILVALSDGSRGVAEKIATDRLRMLTLLKVKNDVAKIAATPLARVSETEVRDGQWSIAVGLAFSGEEPNVSLGMISGKGRIWGKAIQTDAKISPNNYGGPLLDVRGRVIGLLVPLSMMSDELAAGAEMYDGGIGFAIPIDDVFDVVAKLREGRDRKPGFSGLGFREGGLLPGPAEIADVLKNSPADTVGLRKGDRIIGIDGEKVDSSIRAATLLRNRYAGESVELTIRHDGEEKTLTLPLLGRDEIFPNRQPSRVDIP